MYKFYHDPKSRMVFHCKDEPDAISRTHRGKLIGWQVRLEINITRADNWFDSPNHWHFPIQDPNVQDFDHPYTREQAISSFHLRHSPKAIFPDAVEVSESEYKRLEAEYDQMAHNNRPSRKSY